MESLLAAANPWRFPFLALSPLSQQKRQCIGCAAHPPLSSALSQLAAGHFRSR